MPKDELIGIAVEGLAPEDQKTASAATIEVADLVLYYGKRATFEKARSVVIVQFKYSIGSKTLPLRANDAKKTVRKFASAFRSHKRKHGAKSVRDKLQFELITNRGQGSSLLRLLLRSVAPSSLTRGAIGSGAIRAGLSCLGNDLIVSGRSMREAAECFRRGLADVVDDRH
jgi:hypothetical protein